MGQVVDVYRSLNFLRGFHVMNQRHNMIVCLALLAVWAFASTADAGSLCGRRAKCGCRSRVTVTCTCTCYTVSGKACTATAPTCAEALRKAMQLCSGQEIDVCNCYREIHRRGPFGRCRITICPVPSCDCHSAEAAAVKEMTALGLTWRADCHTESGQICIGRGATCAAAVQAAQDKCSEPIEMCTCRKEFKRTMPEKQAQ
jgi:hypothetical protein